jgi:hypothetical protein
VAHWGPELSSCIHPKRVHNLKDLDALLIPRHGESSVESEFNEDLKPGGREQFGKEQAI